MLTEDTRTLAFSISSASIEAVLYRGKAERRVFIFIYFTGSFLPKTGTVPGDVPFLCVCENVRAFICNLNCFFPSGFPFFSPSEATVQPRSRMLSLVPRVLSRLTGVGS